MANGWLRTPVQLRIGGGDRLCLLALVGSSSRSEHSAWLHYILSLPEALSSTSSGNWHSALFLLAGLVSEVDPRGGRFGGFELQKWDLCVVALGSPPTKQGRGLLGTLPRVRVGRVFCESANYACATYKALCSRRRCFN
jgi:hypothetical protein